MRSKIAAKILNETPQEVRDEVKKYAKKMRDKNVYEVIEQAEREIQSLREQLKQVHNKVNFLVKALKEIQNIPETGAYEHKIIEEAFELSGITGLSESLKQ